MNGYVTKIKNNTGLYTGEVKLSQSGFIPHGEGEFVYEGIRKYTDHTSIGDKTWASLKE